MKKRILICMFHQESNTFNPIINALERFNNGDVFEGDRIYQGQLAAKGTIRGAVDAITQAGVQVIPTVFMISGSGGRVADQALDHFCRRLRQHISEAGQLDGVYAELHGATCAETCDDVCGHILALIRSLVGQIPITVSCDLHANITAKMLENADYISGYQTYPHVDLYEAGYRAGSLCMELLDGKKPHRAVCQLPLLLPPAGYTTMEAPFQGLMDRGKALVKEGKLRDFSIFVVQPWLDIPEIASTVIAISPDEAAAKEAAASLAEELWSIREQMWPELVSVDKILDIAEANQSGKPVILADSADSPNGGAVGDSPAVALRLQQRRSRLKVALSLRDPEAVEQAFRLGVGATAQFCIGGKLTPGVPGPFRAEGTVLGLYENDPIHGKQPRLGKVATVRFGNLQILLCTAGSSSRTPEMYRDFGIEPEAQDLLVIKANTSFRAFYKHMTDLIYVADTPGAGASNLHLLPWKHLPQGIYPFDRE